MDVPLESLRNKVATLFGDVLEMAAKRSCWWYGVRLDASNPDSLAQLCGITSIELEICLKLVASFWLENWLEN